MNTKEKLSRASVAVTSLSGGMKRPARRLRIGKRRRQGEVVDRIPGSPRPFKAANLRIKAIQEIVAKGLQPTERQLELEALPALRSRGHGGHHVVRRRVGGQWMTDRSKYDPRAEDVKHATQERAEGRRAKVRKVIQIFKQVAA